MRFVKNAVAATAKLNKIFILCEERFAYSISFARERVCGGLFAGLHREEKRDCELKQD